MKMRKISAVIIALCLISGVFAGCATEAPSDPSADITAPTERASEGGYSETIAAIELNALNSTVEYGESARLISDGGPFLAYISYPRSVGFVDERVEEWTLTTYTEAQNQVYELLKSDSSAQGEINIQFDSYFVNDRYAGILEKGMLITSAMANPADIVKTFNIDTDTGAFLESADILDLAELDSVLSLLRERILSKYPDQEDALRELSEECLEHLIITHEGIVVVLERSKYLPTYLGTQIITLPYDILGSALKLGRETAEGVPSAPSKDTPPLLSAPPALPAASPQNSGIDPSKPMLALTFDDGPSQYTAHVLELLEQYNCRATFFVVGNIVGNRPEVVKRAYDLGCEIGGHSWSHRDLTKLGEADIRRELDDTATAVQAITGARPIFYRPPYGAVNASVKSVSAELNQAIVNWSVDTLDWKTRNADAVYDAVMKDASDRAVILMHDLHGTTAEAMDRVIPALLEKGYQLVTVSELMAYSDKAMQPGAVYYSGK